MGYKQKLCGVHRIPLKKKGRVKEGENRYYCIKCSQEKVINKEGEEQ